MNSKIIHLSMMERKEWKAIRRSRNRVTHSVIFSYGKHTKQIGVFKIKWKKKK